MEDAMKTLARFAGVVFVLALAHPAIAEESVLKVDCDKGETITDALKHAASGDTIRVTGLCQERVTITTDRITLDGQGRAVVDGGGGGPAEFSAVVTVKSASGVTIKGLTIRNGPGEGILAQGGASFTLQAAHVHGNGFTGVSVGGNSTAEVIDTSIHHNGLGVDVYTGSSLIAKGAIAITDNSSNGVDINGEAVLEIRGAHVNASNNGAFGIAVTSGQLAIFGFAISAGSTLDASGNGLAGIGVGAASRMTVYRAASVTASGNGVFGLAIRGNGFLLTLPEGATFLIENNGVGINAMHGAGFIFQGGQLTVTNNGVGLVGDGAGTLTIDSVPATPSSISGNGLDVSLAFGTRATFEGVTIGSITCDPTVLSRGTTVCP
jgi:hypothetical protein